MKKILIILGSLLTLSAFGQDLKYTNPRLMLNKINNANHGTFIPLDLGAKSDDGISDVVYVNQAIDAAADMFDYSFGGGTVYIPAGVYLVDDTIHLRSNVEIAMDRNALLYTENYTGAVFVADPTVTHCYVHGGILFSGQNTMIGISIRVNASGQYMQECGFYDMTIQGCLTGISLWTDNVGFINSNYFDNIWIEDFVNGVVAYEGSTSAGLSGNNFNNLTLQCDDATAYGLKDIDLSYSTFTGLVIWDLPVTATAGITIRNGSKNVFVGGNWSTTGFSDTGLMNKYITGDFIATPPRNTGTVVAGTGITSAMLSDYMIFTTAAAIDITANPQIAAGKTGQKITIIGSSDTNTLTLDDGTGLVLSGQWVGGLGDTITLIYVMNLWVELGRSNN